MYTCFKFRFSTLKWKSAIIDRVNGTSGCVYNMQHTTYKIQCSRWSKKNELICRTVVWCAPSRAFHKRIIDRINDRSTKTLTIQTIAVIDYSQVKMLPYFHVYNIRANFDWHCADISLYYNCSWEREHNGSWKQSSWEWKKKCLTILLKCFKIVSVKGTW